MLFYTGVTRSANSILAEQTANVKATRDQLDLLRDLAGLAADRLRCGDVDAVGDAMRKGWEAKRQLAAGISNPQVDMAVDRALEAGAIGRQADRRGRRRLPAGHLPDGTAARRAGEPGRDAGTAGEAGPARVADRAQCDARHLGLRRHDGVPCRGQRSLLGPSGRPSPASLRPLAMVSMNKRIARRGWPLLAAGLLLAAGAAVSASYPRLPFAAALPRPPPPVSSARTTRSATSSRGT